MQVEQDMAFTGKTEPVISLIVPIKIQTSANMWEHWSKKRARDNTQELMIRLALRDASGVPPGVPCLPLQIKLTRIAPKPLDYDNLVAALKRSVDTVADWITPGLRRGRADSVKGVEFFYGQQKGKVREYGLKIEIWDHKTQSNGPNSHFKTPPSPQSGDTDQITQTVIKNTTEAK